MTPRIRWENDPIGSTAGYVGTHKPWVFQIFKYAPTVERWTLIAQLPGMIGDDVRSPDPDELKSEAERWLSGFVASGAIFPEGECPECGFRPPTHTHDKNCSRYAPDTAATAGKE